MGISPATVDAYYNPSMNDINFPAGILQSPFFDPKATDAETTGTWRHRRHELTTASTTKAASLAQCNLSDWWTPEDAKKFEEKADCEVKEYGSFVAVDDVKVNGK